MNGELPLKNDDFVLKSGQMMTECGDDSSIENDDGGMSFLLKNLDFHRYTFGTVTIQKHFVTVQKQRWRMMDE